MTATEIISEIERLSPVERAKVVQFTSSLSDERLSDAEVQELAEQMIDATDPAEVDRLQKELVHGFYGRSPDDMPLADGQLPGRELGVLARKMAEAADPLEQVRIREELVRGFYGSAPHA